MRDSYYDPPDYEGPCITELKKRRVKKTRKEHECYICGKIIPKGSPAHYLAYVDEEVSPPVLRSVYSHTVDGACIEDY